MAGMMAAAGTPHGVIESPAQAVDAELLVSLHEAGEEHLLGVARSVAISVAEKQNLGSGGDDHTVAPTEDAVGK